MQLEPNHHGEESGAMLGDPSGFNVLMSATGVPKERMVGSIVFYMCRRYRTRTEGAIRILRSNF
jgi:hypothetical protein